MVTLHRSGGAVHYPARFLLVLAANPCPCGGRGHECECAPQARRRYRQRLSGPLLDRVDVRVGRRPCSACRVVRRRRGQRDDPRWCPPGCGRPVPRRLERWRGTTWRTNADVPGAALRSTRWALPPASLAPARGHLQRGQLSARGFDRVLRLAWTIADLGGRTVPAVGDVGEALYFRTGQAQPWAA